MIRNVFIFLLFVWAVLLLFPFYWLAVSALKPAASVLSIPPDLGIDRLTFENFAALFRVELTWKWTFNSFAVALCGVAGNVMLCSMAGYVFAKKQFPGKKLLFWCVIGIMMTSTQVVMVPLFMTVRDMGILNTYAGLILPSLVAPFAVFLTKQFIQTLPNELLAAAKIDGCSEWGIFARIVLPLSLPALAIVAIFTFINHWNDFLWPLLATDSKHMRTLQVGLAGLQLQNEKNFSLILSGAVWTMLPIVIVFVACQRFLIKGITVGAVKG